MAPLKAKERELFSVKVSTSEIKPGKKRKNLKVGKAADRISNKKLKIDGLADDLQPLTYEAITAGQVLLGCVQEVHNFEIIVSLPHKLLGTVSLAHISDAYTDLLSKVKEDDDEGMEGIHTLQELYQPGQHLVTRVVSVEVINDRTKVHLTLMPQEVNFGISPSMLERGHVLMCAVSSIEDNGYIMDTGLPNIRGAFLNKKATEGAGIVGVGSIVRCLVTKIMGSSVHESTLRLKLNADNTAVHQATLDLSETSNMALLIPGTAVNTSVSKIHKDGLNVVMGGTDGVVSRVHLKGPFDKPKQYQLATKVRARVLYIMPLTKIVHLTLQDSVVAKSESLHGLKIGDRIEDAVIYDSRKSGVYLKLGDNCRGFSSSNYLTENNKPPKNVSRDFPVGAQRMCRLLKYSYMDQVFIVSLQKSILEQQIVGYQGVEAGQVLKVAIQGYNDYGAKVAISKFVNGLIPFFHLTNTSMKHPKMKYSVGQVLKVRVLKVNPQRRHMLLTCKKQLVESNEAIVTEYSESVVNTVTDGCIVKIMNSGLLISLYNDVKGFAPKSEVSVAIVDNLEKLFTVGQVVKCKVLEVKPEKKNLTLSLFVEEGKAPNRKKHLRQMDKMQLREKVDCVVKEIKEDTILVHIKPKNILAKIPVAQLSDDVGNSHMIKELLQEGDEIHNAVVLMKDAITLTLTLKGSVSHWVESGSEEAQTASELMPYESYPAITQSVVQYGLHVIIPTGKHGFRGLIHVTNFSNSNKWFDCADLGVHVGQCLFASFKDKDKTDRPNLTSSLDDNMRNVTQSSIQLLYDYLKEQDMIKRGLLRLSGKTGNLAKFEPRMSVKVLVMSVTPVGLLVSLKESGVQAIISSDHQDTETEVKVGQEISACVLHVNQKEKCLELTAKPELIKSLSRKKTAPLKVGMKAKCEVLLSRKNFIMVMLKSRCHGKVAYLPSLRHLNDFNGRSACYSVGQEYSMVMKHIDGDMILGILKEHEKGESLNILFQRPTVVFEPNGQIEEENEDISVLEEKVVKKIKRVRNDSQCSTGSMESIEDTVDEDEKLKEEKFKNLVADNIPQYDEEFVKIVHKRKRMEKMDLNKERKKKKKQVVDGENGASENKSKTKKGKMNEDNVADSGVDEKMDLEEEQQQKRPVKRLIVGTGFVWEVPDVTEANQESSDDEDDDNDAVKKKKGKKMSQAERVAVAHEEERRLHELECARLQADRTPQSALDYEELLQRSPNSSALWIQFISFHLESAEVEQAKTVARRALQVIDTKEEEERLNLWTVLLRLEVTYGTPETVGKAYSEALCTNDQLKIHIAMAMVYAEAGQLQEAEKVYFVMTKKFAKSLNVWVKAGIYFFSHNKGEDARRYLERALLSLDKKHYVELINRYGQLEFQFGEAERGRTMFESLLSSYPKRIDIWSVYVDLLAKRTDYEGARHILERMTGLKLRLRKMRFVFKKFLEFEKKHGSSQSVEAVKKRVEEFVASTLGQEG